MIIYPAIDVRNGQCVRLHQGDFAQTTVYQQDPIDQARMYQRAGATHLHIVDLDGAKQGELAQTALIADIAAQTDLIIQCGGGVRERKHIEQLRSAGVHRVVIGSLAVNQPDLIRQWIAEFGGEHIALALDIHGDAMIATQGWQQTSTRSLWELLTDYDNCGLRHVLCTDIARDGTLTGTNTALYKEAQQHFPKLAWQASGGVRDCDDIDQLAALNVAGVIIGKALYEERFSLEDALHSAGKTPC